jgi:hypothetical protein
MSFRNLDGHGENQADHVSPCQSCARHLTASLFSVRFHKYNFDTHRSAPMMSELETHAVVSHLRDYGSTVCNSHCRYGCDSKCLEGELHIKI